MKSYSRIIKIAALFAVIISVALLAGCKSKPDTGGDDIGGGAIDNNQYPFPVLTTPAVSSTPEPTSTIAPISLPSPSATTQGAQVLPWDSTAIPGAFITPTVSPSIDSTATIALSFSTGTPSPQPTVYVIKLGSKGQDVKEMQRRLKDLGYLDGSADGDFGKKTEDALKDFQRRNDLKADGIAGRATLSRLQSSSAKRALPKATATLKATATPRIKENLYLQLGDSGRDVTKMQERLIELGYLEGKASGRFDSSTEQAVYAFQKRNVAYSDGIAGPLTLKALYSSNARRTSSAKGVVGVSLRRGMTDSKSVQEMQARLKDLGYYAGSRDGDFGASTEEAVKAFQRAHGLTVDGVAGTTTLNKLYSSEARKAGSTAGSTTAPRVTPIPKPTEVINYTNVTPHPSGDYVTLREGNSGVLVRNLQNALKSQGYLRGSVDGKYGEATTEAVTRFQQDKGLSMDGVAGPATQRVLFEGNYPKGS